MPNLAQNLASLLSVFLFAMVCSLAITPLVRAHALKSGAMDVPDGRRIHLVPTPRWGGIAIYASNLNPYLKPVSWTVSTLPKQLPG